MHRNTLNFFHWRLLKIGLPFKFFWSKLYTKIAMETQGEIKLQDFRLLTNKEGSNSKGEIGRGSYSKVLLGLFNKD